MAEFFSARYVIGIPAALALQYVTREGQNLQADAGSVGTFVTAIGTLYSVLAGFTVITVWQQFIDLDRAVKREARNLREVWRYVGYVEDSNAVGAARAAIEQYRSAVVAEEWQTMVDGRTPTAAEAEYQAMEQAVSGMKVSSAKDVPAWAEAVRNLGEVGDARGERAALCTQRIPVMLRMLLYVTTFSLVFGMAVLRFESLWVGAAILIFTVVISLYVLKVIDDLDDPFSGAWLISTAPLKRIQFGDKTSMPNDQDAIERVHR